MQEKLTESANFLPFVGPIFKEKWVKFERMLMWLHIKVAKTSIFGL
jgi:hypothetical protein